MSEPKSRYERHLDYHRVFGGVEGARVLEDLKAAHYINGSTAFHPVGGQIDPLKMAFREGERNVVLRILSILQTDPTTLKEEAENE